MWSMEERPSGAPLSITRARPRLFNAAKCIKSEMSAIIYKNHNNTRLNIKCTVRTQMKPTAQPKGTVSKPSIRHKRDPKGSPNAGQSSSRLYSIQFYSYHGCQSTNGSREGIP